MFYKSLVIVSTKVFPIQISTKGDVLGGHWNMGLVSFDINNRFEQIITLDSNQSDGFPFI